MLLISFLLLLAFLLFLQFTNAFVYCSFFSHCGLPSFTIILIYILYKIQSRKSSSIAIDGADFVCYNYFAKQPHNIIKGALTHQLKLVSCVRGKPLNPISKKVILKDKGDTYVNISLQYKIGSRGKGQSAVAAAAYRSGQKLTDEELGAVSDYTRKSGVVYSEVSLCDNAPAEYINREILWNSVQTIEKASNSRLWREFEVALPQELSREEQIDTVRDYVKH